MFARTVHWKIVNRVEMPAKMDVTLVRQAITRTLQLELAWMLHARSSTVITAHRVESKGVTYALRATHLTTFLRSAKALLAS